MLNQFQIRDEFSQWRSHAMAIVRLVVEGSYDSVDFEKTDEHPTIFNKLLHDDSFACEDFNQVYLSMIYYDEANLTDSGLEATIS